jgi:hypothetical protein
MMGGAERKGEGEIVFGPLALPSSQNGLADKRLAIHQLKPIPHCPQVPRPPRRPSLSRAKGRPQANGLPLTQALGNGITTRNSLGGHQCTHGFSAILIALGTCAQVVVIGDRLFSCPLWYEEPSPEP